MAADRVYELRTYTCFEGKLEALKARGGEYHVVLMDIQMPEMDGIEAVLRIRSGEAGEGSRRIPVVALTSSRETQDLIEFYKHGVNAYVVKPVDFPDFVEVVKQLGVFWAAVNEPPPALSPNRSLVTPRMNSDAACFGSTARAMFSASGSSKPSAMTGISSTCNPMPCPRKFTRRSPKPMKSSRTVGSRLSMTVV